MSPPITSILTSLRSSSMVNRKHFFIVFSGLLGMGLLWRPLNYDPYNTAIPCKLFICPGAGFPFDLRVYNDELGTYHFDFVVLAVNLCVLIIAMMLILLLIKLVPTLSKKEKTHENSRH